MFRMPLVCPQVRSHLEVLERGSNATVAIVGAGYAGVELAVAVAERLGVAAGNVRLVTPGPDIMPGADAGQRASAHRKLSQLGVTVMVGTSVASLQQADTEPGRPLTRRRIKLNKVPLHSPTFLPPHLRLHPPFPPLFDLRIGFTDLNAHHFTLQHSK